MKNRSPYLKKAFNWRSRSNFRYWLLALVRLLTEGVVPRSLRLVHMRWWVKENERALSLLDKLSYPSTDK